MVRHHCSWTIAQSFRQVGSGCSYVYMLISARRDLEGVDSQLPDNMGRTVEFSLSLLTTLVAVTATTPIFLIGFAVLLVGYQHYARLYSHTARELRRLDSVTKSPLFSLYGETVSGVSVIRAYGCPSRFLATVLQRIDTKCVTPT